MMATRRYWFAAALALGLATMPARAQTPVTVFAAASLKNALDDIAASWTRDTGKTARLSYAGSNVLAKQIESGAPADLFVSADGAWMDYAEKAGTLRAGTRSDLLRNAIVVIAPREATVSLDLKEGSDLPAALARALGEGRLATGNVEAVPAGKYAKAALQKLGAWEDIKDRIAQADNVRAALLLVSRGEAPLGIVYATDAAADPKVKVVSTFPADSHPPIIYPLALTQASANPDADVFLAYLKSPAARPYFERQGFTVIGGAGPRY